MGDGSSTPNFPAFARLHHARASARPRQNSSAATEATSGGGQLPNGVVCTFALEVAAKLPFVADFTQKVPKDSVWELGVGRWELTEAKNCLC